MRPQYLHLTPDALPPTLTTGRYRAVIVSEIPVDQAWRNRIADWIVRSGCMYVVAWGVECEMWHDAVDWTNLEKFDYGEIPDERFVMTTWNGAEPLSEALWFAGQCAFHPNVQLAGTLIVHVAHTAKPMELLSAFDESQILPDDD